jgi:phosphopantetheinyl transferase (holo-ACP synthase)
MISTGNDIVALTAINVVRTKQTGFYSRIISSAEHAFYQSELQNKLRFEHFVWLAWSVKESAYKYLKRFDTGLIFSPSKMRIVELEQTLECFKGALHFGDQLLYSQSVINTGYIFSIVNGRADFSQTYWDIKQIESNDPASQSEVVREFLLERLDQLFMANDFQIAKSLNGWPLILNGDGELPIPISLTHHDHFVAYSFQLTDSLWKARQHHAEVL